MAVLIGRHNNQEISFIVKKLELLVGFSSPSPDKFIRLRFFMTQVTVGENEGIESALRRFKRQVSKSGIFADLKRIRHHETPVEKYKRKAQQRRRSQRR